MRNDWEEIEKKVKEIKIEKERLKEAKIILFGTRMNGSFAYEKMKKEYTIFAFSDNNSEYWGGNYEGLPVIPPEQLKKIENVFVIITVTGHHYLPIKKQLSEMGIPYITYMEYVLFYKYDKFKMVYDELLEDDFSKRTYLHILMSHLSCDMNYLREIFVRNQYFEIPEFCVPISNEVFIDCGAYTGDTLENYINRKIGIFEKIYCFEPTEETFHALCVRRERLLREWTLDEKQIIAEKKIVTSKSEVKYFMDQVNGKDSNRMVKDNSIKAKQIIGVSLDEYFADKEEKPTFIKADIEGAEMEMLEGAAGIIANRKPLLAICIYHKVEDLYEIPILLKRLNPEYKMSIRHHMPNYYETVLYCY